MRAGWTFVDGRQCPILFFPFFGFGFGSTFAVRERSRYLVMYNDEIQELFYIEIHILVVLYQAVRIFSFGSDHSFVLIEL